MRSATQGEKAALVQELHKEGHRLNDLLDAIGLSRSTYYYELGRTDKVKERNADLSSEIVSIFNENRKRYGVRSVHRELLNRGFLVNHKRVQRIMNQFALCGKRPKEKYHSYKGDVGKVADNIINRDFSTEKPLQKHGIIQSMSRKGNCYDNCIMETFFGRLKNEMFYGLEKDYPSFESFSKAIAEYINYYNNTRIQAKTKWMPPSKFREASMMEA